MFAFHLIIGTWHYYFWVVQKFKTAGVKINAKSTSVEIFINVLISLVLVFSSKYEWL